MLMVAEQIVTELGAEESDEYRVVINNKLCRDQTGSHPQIHVMAGRELDWPPGWFVWPLVSFIPKFVSC